MCLEFVVSMGQFAVANILNKGTQLMETVQVSRRRFIFSSALLLSSSSFLYFSPPLLLFLPFIILPLILFRLFQFIIL
jgi:hypothetical protein